MFEVGKLIIYSSHGICKIDGISEKVIMGESKYYYDLHPVNASSLKISIPVDNDSIVMLELINKEEAEEILASFKYDGIAWIDKNTERQQTYSNMIKKGNREDIAKIINTLMRHKLKLELINKKLNNQDQNLLNSIQQILFNEIAISLEVSYEAILERVNHIITVETDKDYE